MGLKQNKTVSNIFTYIILTVASLFILLPVLWVIRTSFASEIIAYEIPPKFFFVPTMKNYIELFGRLGFGSFLKNSLIIAIGCTVISVPIAALGGFAFTRYRTSGTTLKFSVLATQMLPGIILVLPIFVIFNTIHFTNTYTGIILATLSFNLPFLVWLLMGFFEGIPKDIEDAATVDGATPWSTFFRIVLPITVPGIMSASILSFILSWNEFLFALLLTGNDTKTITVSLSAMVTHRGTLIGILSAGTIIAIIPMILLSIFVKKYLIEGLTFGAVKE
jgi:multiple sugar transport system permease protein